jgi:hypothetical protein
MEINPSTGALTSKSYRIESQPGREDRVYGACKQEGAQTAFYVVGVTTGNLMDSSDTRVPTEQAFIMKLQVVNSKGFSREWVRQVGASANGGSAGAQGLACAVTNDGKVYMVGRVDSRAVLSNTGYKSAGGTDAFIMQMEAENGQTRFIHQFGSSSDEYVRDVVTDMDGNALVYGTTDGSMYRANGKGEQDIFLLSFSGVSGTYDAPMYGTTTPDSSAGTTPNVATTDNQGDSRGDNNKVVWIAVSIITMSIVALVGFFFYRRVSYVKSLCYSDEDHDVLRMLKGFDDAEMDLMRSATGGWHGTYLNPLYQSSETYSYNSETTDTTDASIRFDGNSSYVRDSLFMDDYNLPSLGSHDDERMSDEQKGLTKQRSNYDGLLDAYNTTWDDLSPHVMPTLRPASKRDLSDKKHGMETIEIMKDDDAWKKEII